MCNAQQNKTDNILALQGARKSYECRLLPMKSFFSDADVVFLHENLCVTRPLSGQLSPFYQAVANLV
jgi:hypothetical protein